MDGNLKKIRKRNIILPIFIGLGVVGYLLYKEFDPKLLKDITFTWTSAFWIFLAILCMVGRDLGYIIRIRILSDNKLSWKQAFRVIMLWEFTSAATPGAVGGTGVALVYVHKEGISIGKSTFIVMLTSFLDEVYFVVMFPILLLIIGSTNVFHIPEISSWTSGIKTVALVGYGIKLAWTLLLAYGLFINSKAFAKLIYRVFHLPILRKWKRSAAKAAIDVQLASKELDNKGFKFWIEALFSTFLSWTSRYWVVNCLLLAFFTVDKHMVIFARQLIMSIVLLVSPTPGGSGVAEIMFDKFLGEFVPIAGFAIALAFLWRLVSYYPYLFIGVLIIPKWINDKFVTKDDSKVLKETSNSTDKI